MNYPLLKDLLETAPYLNLDAVAAAAKLNEATIAQNRAVAKVDTLNYLMGATDVWDKLLAAIENPIYPPELQRKIRKFQTTVTSYEQTDYANFTGETGTLVGLNILTQKEVDDFMALAVVYISPAQELFGEDVTPAQVNAARWLDQINAFDARIGLLTALRDDMESGNAYHELSEVQ